MTQKHNETISTMRYYNDSMSNSFDFSEIFANQGKRNCQKLNNSVQYFKSPYIQTIPLKFPKNRIIKPHHQHHMLQESTTPKKRNCIKLYGLKNKQSIQTIWRQKKINQAYKNTIFVPKGHHFQLAQIFQSKSLQNLNKSDMQFSPSKQSKKIFYQKIFHQSMKNPILFGDQINKKQNLLNKKQSLKCEKTSQNFYCSQKNDNKGTKYNFEWNVNKSLQKQRFNNKYFHNNNSKYIKKQPTTIIQQKNKNNVSKQTIKVQKPKTYKDIYILRKAK